MTCISFQILYTEYTAFVNDPNICAYGDSVCFYRQIAIDTMLEFSEGIDLIEFVLFGKVRVLTYYRCRQRVSSLYSLPYMQQHGCLCPHFVCG